MLPHPFFPACRRNNPARTFEQKPSEQPARHAAHCRHTQNPSPHFRQGDTVKRVEIRVVAQHRHLHKPRCQNADENLPLPAQHHPASQLFNCKNHTGQRRIECRRQTARRACGQQIVVLQARERQITLPAPASPARHHRRAHLHGRSFTPDGRARQHPEKRQRHFIQRLAESHRPFLRFAIGQRKRGKHLRDAAACRIGRETARQPCNQHQRGGHHGPCEPRIPRHPVRILFQCKLRHACERDGYRCHQSRADQQIHQRHGLARQAAHLPVFPPPDITQAAHRKNKCHFLLPKSRNI